MPDKPGTVESLRDSVGDLRAELALLRGSEAPVVFFEIVSTHGLTASVVGNLTLEAGMHMGHDGKMLSGARVMAHLRFPLTAIPSMRQALDQIELLARKTASDEKN